MTDTKTLEDRYLLPTYEKLPFALSRGQGCWVEAEDGTRYLDLYGGHAVALLGHCPDAVAKAVARQARELLFYSNVAYHAARGEAAKALVELCGEPGSRVFFCNSGAEANENAMRIARAATGRAAIVVAEGGFHGRTAGALAATARKYRQGVAGLATDVVHVPFGDVDAAAAALRGAAAFLVEPIQSVGGIMTAPPEYFAGLEAACRGAGALLIFDEVQTGLGRVGRRSAAELYDVKPALQTFAKALGSGIPAGAVLAAPALAAAVKPGALGSTFGGGPLACAAIKATLDTISRERLWENAAAIERLVFETLDFPQIVTIRGRGLLLGLVLDRPSKPVRAALLERRIIVGGADDPFVIRLMPPLTIGAAEIALLRGALSEIFAAGATLR